MLRIRKLPTPLLMGLLAHVLAAGCSTQSPEAVTENAATEAQPVDFAADSHDSSDLTSLDGDDSPSGSAVKPGVNTDGINTDVEPLFDNLIVALKQQDIGAVNGLMDARRMFQEIERQQLFAGWAPIEKTALRAALAASIGDGLLEEAVAGGWNDLKIHRIDANPEQEVVRVSTRIGSRDGIAREAVRFWLVRTDDGWKVFDWEEANSFLRASSYIGATLAALRTDAETESYQRTLYAARLVAEGRFQNAQTVLDQAPESPLPDYLEAGRWLLYAQTKFAEDDAQTAKRCLDAAATLNPDFFAMPKLLSACHASLGEYEQSLAYAREALERLGGDAEIHVRMGDALAELGNPDEAAKSYRKGLDIERDSVVCLLGLSNVLPGEEAGEVGERFEKFTDQTASFEEVMQALLGLDRFASAAAVLKQFKSHSVDEQLIAYYEAELELERGQVEAAAARLKELAANATSQEAKSLFESRLVQAFVSAGKPVEAYDAGTDKRAVFAYVAESLLSSEDSKGLLAVASKHEKIHPDDISVYLYKGSAHYFDKSYSEAEKELARGMTLAETESIRDRFRQFRVLARFRMGEGLSAYTDIPPRDKTFDQLARLFLAEKQSQQLEQLVSLHRKSNPGDAALNVLVAEAKLLAADYERAAALITSAIAESNDEREKLALRDKLLEIHLDGGTPLVAYTQAADAEHAFRYLAERLLADEDGSNLLKLAQAHRARVAGQDIVEGAEKDLQLDYYEGRAKSLMKDFAGAAAVFSKGYADAGDGRQREAFREQLVLARAKLGEGLKAYHEVTPQFDTYDQLAQYYANTEDADNLDTLLETHSKNRPDDPTLPLWKAEVHWLRKEYGEVADVLLKHRVLILSDPLNRGRFEDRLIRSLLRASRWEDARREAKLSTSRDDDPWFEAVVATASGDLKEASEALRACVARGYTAAHFYADEDLGPALRSEDFSKLREAYLEVTGEVDVSANPKKQE